MLRVALVVLALSLLGCGGAIAASAHDATQSVLATFDAAASKKEIDDVATSAGAAAGTAMRDEALSPETTARLNALAAVLRAELVATRDQVLDATLRAELRQMRDALLVGLDAQVRVIVRAAVDEALSGVTVAELGAMREQMVGAPLRADLDAATADLRTQLTTVRADADAEVARYRVLMIVVGIAAAVMFVLHVRREILVRRGAPA